MPAQPAERQWRSGRSERGASPHTLDGERLEAALGNGEYDKSDRRDNEYC
jgi:hypothetical protein